MAGQLSGPLETHFWTDLHHIPLYSDSSLSQLEFRK